MYLAEYVLQTFHLEKNQQEIIIYDERKNFDHNLSSSNNPYNFTKKSISPKYYLTDFVEYEFYWSLRKAAETENNVKIFQQTEFHENKYLHDLAEMLFWSNRRPKFMLVNDKFYYQYIKTYYNEYSSSKKEYTWGTEKYINVRYSSDIEEVIYTSTIPYNRIFLATENIGIMCIKDINGSQSSFAIEINGQEIACGIFLDLI